MRGSSPVSVWIGRGRDLKCGHTHRHLRGAIVCLDELGHLSCNYLGTDPTLFVATLDGGRELNYEVRGGGGEGRAGYYLHFAGG